MSHGSELSHLLAMESRTKQMFSPSCHKHGVMMVVFGERKQARRGADALLVLFLSLVELAVGCAKQSEGTALIRPCSANDGT